MKFLIVVATFCLTACSNVPATLSSDYLSLVKVAITTSGTAGDAYLRVSNGSANSVGVFVPLFVFSKTRYRKCGTGRIDVEGHVHELPPTRTTDISLKGLHKSNTHVGIFVYADGSSDQGDHCIVWSDTRMS